MPNGYKPVPTETAKMVATPSMHIDFPHVNFTRAIGEALGDLGAGYQTLGSATGQVGAALASAGKMAEGAGSEIFNRALAIQEVKNEAETNELRTKWEMESGVLENQYLTTFGSNASDGLPAYMKNVEKLRNDYAAKASNIDVKRRFDNQSMFYMGKQIIAGGRHAATETKRYAVESSNASIALDKENAAKNWDDPRVYNSVMDDIKRKIKDQRDTMGHSADWETVRINEEMADLRAKHIAGMAKERPFQAYQEFQEADKKGEIFGPQRDQLENTLNENLVQTVGRNSSDSATADLRGRDPDKTRSLTDRQQDAAEKAVKALPEGSSDRVKDLARDRAISETDRKWNQWDKGNKQYMHDQYGLLIDGISGKHSDGNVPEDLDALLAIPKMAAAYDAIEPAQQRLIRTALRKAKEEGMKVDPELSYSRLEKLKGDAQRDPAQFLEKTINPYELGLNKPEVEAVKRLRDKARGNPLGDPNVNRAIRWIRDKYGSEMRDLGIAGKGADDEAVSSFTGAVTDAIDTLVQEKNRAPTREEVLTRIAPFVLQHSYSGGILGMFRTEHLPSWKEDIPDTFKEEYTRRAIGAGKTQDELPRDDNEWRRIYNHKLFLDSLEKPPRPLQEKPEPTEPTRPPSARR